MDTFHHVAFFFKVPMFRKPKKSSESSEKKEQRLARYPADKNGWLMARDLCFLLFTVNVCWRMLLFFLLAAKNKNHSSSPMLVEKKCCVDVSRTAVLPFRGCTCRPIPMIHPFLWCQNTCFTICRQLILLLLRMSPIKRKRIYSKWFVTSMSSFNVYLPSNSPLCNKNSNSQGLSSILPLCIHHPILSSPSNMMVGKNLQLLVKSWPRSIFQIWRSVHLRAIHPVRSLQNLLLPLPY